MIASDHGHPNAALVAFLDRSYRFIAGRIDDPDKSQQNELSGQPLRSQIDFVYAAIFQTGKR
jgi:hypothetical protein